MALSGTQIVATQKISFKNVIRAAAFLGALQAIIWMILSLISIGCYNRGRKSTDHIIYEQPEYDYGYYINVLYLDGNIDYSRSGSKFIIYPKTFNIFMYFYLILSSIWLIISWSISWAMAREKWNYVKNFMAAWCGVTSSIATFDIVLMSSIAADIDCYKSMTSSAEMPSNEMGRELVSMETQMVLASMGIVMTIAARGYILWILNVAFAINFVVLVQRMKKQEQQSKLLSFIDVYRTRPRPHNPYDSTDIGPGNWNHGYQPNENIIYSPSRNGELPPENFDMFRPAEPSWMPSAGPTRPESYPRPMEGAPAVQRLAKIGKSTPGHQFPLRNVSVPQVQQMPYIPPHDYNPPGSPNSIPRSVLRPKSNYVLENLRS